MPITCDGLSVELARSVIEIEEVLLAIIADFLMMRSTEDKTDFLTFAFYTMASTTKSTSLVWRV